MNTENFFLQINIVVPIHTTFWNIELDKCDETSKGMMDCKPIGPSCKTSTIDEIKKGE